MERSRFRWFTGAAVLALTLLIAAAPAAAQFYAGARGSAFLPNGSSDGLEDFDTGWGAEAFAGFRVNPNVALEAGAGYYRTEWSDSDDVISEKDTVKAVPLTITAKGIAPLGERARLYAGAGIGVYFAKGEAEGSWREEGMDLVASDSSSDTAFGYHLVAGGEFMISPQVGLDVQAKWFKTKPSFTFFEDTADPTSVKVDIGGIMLSVGLLFQL